MGFPHGRVGRNLPDGEAYAYCGVIVEGSGLGEPVRKVSHPVISPLSEHRRGLIMLCNSDFSERLGRMGVRDFGLERGRSPLWISNHPRFHGSAWKVPALDIEPSTISRFSVESPRPEAVTKRAERANGGARATCFEQPDGVYSGCVDARPAKYTSSYSVSTHPRHEA